MALIDLYRRYMYGTPASVDTGSEVIEGTKGLIGFGGERGGGLLNTFEQPDTQGLYTMASNPFVGIGASLFTRGQRGQTPGMAIGDSVMQGMKFSETAARLGDAKKKRELIEKYKDQIPEEDKDLFLINPSGYIAAMLKKRSESGSLSKAAYDLYEKGRNAPDFKKWFEGLNQAEKDLYNKQVKPNLSSMEAAYKFIQDQTDKLLKNAPELPMSGDAPDTTKLQQGIIYNYNGQLVVFDGKKIISYQQSLKK
tara:strand:- start:841 stop:1596 length:756 start_codon:yes stop_codon:yes gene_type:complete